MDILQESSENCRRILTVFVKVLNSTAGYNPADERLIDAGYLAEKQFLHAASAYQLSRHIDLTPLGLKGTTLDNSSISILMRGALEAYLTMYHVFVEPGDDNCREFRYCAWKLAGFTLHEKNDPPAVTEEHKRNRESILKHNEDFRNRLRSTAEFKELKEKQQRRLLRGYWKMDRSWIDIGTTAGIDRGWLENVYGILSLHTHSSSYSTFQLGLARDQAAEKQNVAYSLFFLCTVMSLMILDFTRLVDIAKPAAEQDQKIYELMNDLKYSVVNLNRSE